MVYKIQNSDTTKETRDALRASISEGFPQDVEEKIRAVINVNPKDYRICNISRGATKTNSGTQVVYLTPTNKDFYLTGCTLSYNKSVATDTGFSDIQLACTIDGAVQELLTLACMDLTAESHDISIVFPFPIKVDRNTNILIQGATYSAGAMTRAANIVGYEVEP